MAFRDSSAGSPLARYLRGRTTGICGEPSILCAKANETLRGKTLEWDVRTLDRASAFKLRFWPLQAGGWTLYAIAIATSNLALRHEKELVAFRATFLLSAFLASFAMYALCKSLLRHQASLLTSLITCLLACSVLGLGCSAISLWSEVRFGGSTYPFHWASAFSGMTGGAFVLIAWSAIYFGVKQYQALEEEKRLLRVAETSARNAQLLALRYQLQPHFLFNTLNAISSLVVGEKPQLATQMISRLAELLRSTLDAPEIHFVTLAEELVVVKEYLAIEEVRFGSRLRVQMHVPAEILAVQVPRFILQPLVENAIRHGISHMPAGGRIVFTATKYADTLALRMENDFVVRQVRANGETGVGLANTRERLNQIYGGASSFAAAEEGQTFVLALRIPITSSEHSHSISVEGARQ
jgi:sensor histidine kinase YesM